jgi:hypothetical protein
MARSIQYTRGLVNDESSSSIASQACPLHRLFITQIEILTPRRKNHAWFPHMPPASLVYELRYLNKTVNDRQEWCKKTQRWSLWPFSSPRLACLLSACLVTPSFHLLQAIASHILSPCQPFGDDCPEHNSYSLLGVCILDISLLCLD